MQSNNPRKKMGQSKEIKQKRKGQKNFDISFFAIFRYYDQGILWKGDWALGSASNPFWDFSYIS